MTDWQKLTADLIAAKLEATRAAAAVSDAGSCNMDSVRLFGVRWTSGLRRALAAADVRGRRSRWLGSVCVDLGLGGFGQGAKNTAAVEAAAKCLGDRGWKTSVFYMVD